MARERATEKLNVPVNDPEIRGDTVVVTAARKQIRYLIIRTYSCDEKGYRYAGGDRYKLEELDVRTIPFWRNWLRRRSDS